MKIGIGFLAGLLAMGLAFSANAGNVSDVDNDGVPDAFDNCVNIANGPSAGTNSCVAQEDSDGDGNGNACDGDIDQSGGGPVDGADVLALFGQLFGTGKGDLNCDGIVDGADTLLLFGILFGPVPTV